MDARKTAWDRLMTYRFEDADSDRLSIETIDALTYARDMLATQQSRIEDLEKALESIANPVAYLQKEAERDGYRLNSSALAIASDAEFLKELARAALLQEPTNERQEKRRAKRQVSCPEERWKGCAGM